MEVQPSKWKRTKQHSHWHVLPPELLGEVLRCIPSLADRARFRTVCRQWSCAARQYPPPRMLPWLVLHPGDASFILSMDSGTADRFANLPGENTRCCGAVDDFLIVANADHSEFSLFNPFSKAIVPLPELAISPHRKILHAVTCKVVVCSAAGLVPGSLVAAKHAGLVIFCHLGMGLSLTTSLLLPFGYTIDIAFYRGKLYALSDEGDLFAFEVNVDGGKFKAAHSKCIANDCFRLGDAWGVQDKVCRYLVESRGKLLMVVRYASIRIPRNKLRTYWSEVFEAEFNASPPRWKRIRSLDGEMLFISESCSRSLPACRYDGEQSDRIYFTRDGRFIRDSPLFNSCIFDMRDGMVKPFPLTTEPDRDKWFQTWLFPPE